MRASDDVEVVDNDALLELTKNENELWLIAKQNPTQVSAHSVRIAEDVSREERRMMKFKINFFLAYTIL